MERIGPEGISRRRASKELSIGYATLKRLLDARIQPSSESGEDTPALVVAITCGEEYGHYDPPVALLT